MRKKKCFAYSYACRPAYLLNKKLLIVCLLTHELLIICFNALGAAVY